MDTRKPNYFQGKKLGTNWEIMIWNEVPSYILLTTGVEY